MHLSIFCKKYFKCSRLRSCFADFGAVRSAVPDRRFGLTAIHLAIRLISGLQWINLDQPNCVLYVPIRGDPGPQIAQIEHLKLVCTLEKQELPVAGTIENSRWRGPDGREPSWWGGGLGELDRVGWLMRDAADEGVVYDGGSWWGGGGLVDDGRGEGHKIVDRHTHEYYWFLSQATMNGSTCRCVWTCREWLLNNSFAHNRHFTIKVRAPTGVWLKQSCHPSTLWIAHVHNTKIPSKQKPFWPCIIAQWKFGLCSWQLNRNHNLVLVTNKLLKYHKLTSGHMQLQPSDLPAGKVQIHPL